MKTFNRKQKERIEELRLKKKQSQQTFDNFVHHNKDAFGKIDESSAVYRNLFNRMTRDKENWEFYFLHGFDKSYIG